VLTEAIENFTTSLGTAIGSATLKSIDAISEVNQSVASSGVDLSAEGDEESLDIGVYQPDIIVLLTDGANSRGPQPIVAAQQAADRQVRVYTIGFGSDDPGQLVCSSQQIGGDAFSGGFGGFGGPGTFGGGGGRTFDGGGFGGGAPWYLLLDEETLRGMAEITGGEYFRAQNADQLFQIFRDLPSEIVLQKELIEISFVFAILGAVFVILAVSLSVLWHRFP
jgi:Ca-activated chloride channel family protein